MVHCNEINTVMPVEYQLNTSVIVSGMPPVHCNEINTGMPVEYQLNTVQYRV